MTTTAELIPVNEVMRAARRLKNVALRTPLQLSYRLSEQYGAKVYLKREDLQAVRSYKIRGAYNKMATLSAEEKARGVVCASAGNHAQGVAMACALMEVHGTIFMPTVTPQQKVNKVRSFGKEFVEVVLTGDTYDDAYEASLRLKDERGATYVHPFDDRDTIAGQGTVGLEIHQDCDSTVDYLLMAVGGGGLSAGVGSVFKQLSEETKLFGVEPAGAPAMKESIARGEVLTLDKIDSFVDGAAVRRVGSHNFPIVREVLEDVLIVAEGQVCATMLELYNEDGLVVEPAGSLSVAALDQLATREDLTSKTVVCIIGGGNNDITRTAEIQERALLHAGLKHYFIVDFPQRAGALRDFLNLLGPEDDIAHFEYTKKHNRASGPAVVGIELQNAADFPALLRRMDEGGIRYDHLNDRPLLFDMLVM